ncbi:hypothetical protein AB0D57_45630 [Streptomyces sp. NPDC048275]|uniref:hypothetical protein n=1 Tax=Streptomyces sp. NPDC048275 TaxID=3155629 RepID=UPI0033CAA1DF
MGTALLTYAATRGQVRDQGRVSHAHWLRETRQKAYSDFIIAANAASKSQGACEEQVRKVRALRWVTQDDVDRLGALDGAAVEATLTLHERSVHVYLAGPTALGGLGGEMTQAIFDALREIRDLHPAIGTQPEQPPDAYDTLQNLKHAEDNLFGRFQELARSTLDHPAS